MGYVPPNIDYKRWATLWAEVNQSLASLADEYKTEVKEPEPLPDITEIPKRKFNFED